MTREEYKSTLLNNGFKFLKTQKGYPGKRGEDDVYSHPDFKFNFYVSGVDENIVGLLTGKTIGEQLENVCPPNFEDTYAPHKGYYVWVDDAFLELMKKI